MPRPFPQITPLEPRFLLSSDADVFHASGFLPTVADGAGSAVTADFNHDGRLDLAVIGIIKGTTLGSGSHLGAVQILLNQGKGNFTAGPLQTLVDANSAIASADFNGDGNPDVALFDQGSLEIFNGNGDGSLTLAGQFLANYGNFSLYTGDFNGDGRIDLAANGGRFVSYNSKTGEITEEAQIAVLLNDGNGRFTTVFTHIGDGVHSDLAVIDYDHNGRADIAYPANGTLKILTSKGDGTFNFPASIDTGPIVDVISADLNRDSRPDLIFTVAGSTSARYVMALPAGGFGPILQLPAVSGDLPVGILAGDFNGDGRTDILAGAQGVRGALLQQSNGSFLNFPDSSSVQATVVGDFNNDGSDDIGNGGQIFYASPLLAAMQSPAYVSLKHTLVITGNRRADVLHVSLTGGNYVVSLDKSVYSFPASSVRRLQIATGLGADSITIDPSIFCNALISSGAGDDTVHSGSGNDTLQGDNGNDILDGGAGNDSLQGGKDNDTLTGGAGIDSIFGNRGTDLFSSVDAIDEVLDRTPEQGEI